MPRAGDPPFTEQEATDDPLWGTLSKLAELNLTELSQAPGFSGSPLQVLAATYKALLETNPGVEEACTQSLGVAAFAVRTCLVADVQEYLAFQPTVRESDSDLRKLLALHEVADHLDLRLSPAPLVTFGIFGGIPTVAVAEMINLAAHRTFIAFEEGKRRVRSELAIVGAGRPST